jgi:amino acid transporter
LAAVPADRATDTILSFEGVTILLIIVAAAVVLIKLLGHSGPGHLGFTMSVFTPAKGTTTSNVFLGVVFGFLSFGGFEAAAALGGEASRPRRDIPRAIIGTVVIIGIFYVVISAIEMMGFGTSKAGLENFANSPALLGTLGQTYVAKWFGDLIIAGTVVSAFGCCMASCVGASRLIYSFARDGLSPDHAVARVSRRYGTPIVAVGVVIAVELVLEIVLGGLVGAAPLTVFAWSGTISTFLILIAYGLVTVGAAAFLFVRPLLQGRPTKARTAEIALPVAGVALLLYTIYRNVVPYPTGSSAWLPVAAGIWLLIAVVAVAVAPSVSRRLGQQLVTDEGFETATPGEHLRQPVIA